MTNGKNDIIIESSGIKNIKKVYYKQLYNNKCEY